MLSWRRAACIVLSLGSEGSVSVGDEAAVAGEDDATCDSASGGKRSTCKDVVVSQSRRLLGWPCKGGDMNHSGLAAAEAEPSTKFDLSVPSWAWEEPSRYKRGVGGASHFEGSPVIDEEGNLYVASTSGWLYSLDRHGGARWSLQCTSTPGATSDVVLHAGFVYTMTNSGEMLAVDAVSGSGRWRRKICPWAPGDGMVLSASGTSILTPCSFEPPDAPWRLVWHAYAGADALCAVSTTDGQVQWKYSLYERSQNVSYNMVSTIVGGRVFISDMSGGVYALALADGAEIWYTPGIFKNAWTTASLMMGPNDVIYYGFNPRHPSGWEAGTLRAFDSHTGAVLWQTSFPEGVNVPPAIGRVFGVDALSLVVAVGSNPSCDPIPLVDKAKLWFGMLDMRRYPSRHGVIYSVDPANGQTRWTFALPPNPWPTAGISFNEPCCPDMFGQPTIGPDGTVYVNWSGGKSYALRDANGDGKVDPGDPLEVTSFEHNEGTLSNTAIGPGIKAFLTCKRLYAYTS